MTTILADDPAWGIILAAGSSTRMREACNNVPKQFVEWRGLPLYWHSVLAFARCACIEGLVLVFPEKFLAAEKERITNLIRQSDPGLPVRAIGGGPTRQQSSRLGLANVPLTAKKVLIHDAARPFASPDLIWKVCQAVTSRRPGVIPALPVKDTLKIIKPDFPDLIEATPMRALFRSAQTPQGFVAPILREAHAKCGNEVTDDAMLLENLGLPVLIVNGEEKNIKITTPADLNTLNRDNSSTPVTGFGYDAHRYGAGHPLILGGVRIPGNFQIIAHSDGDVLLHALVDAILGAACLGDIGSHFPDDDPQYAGISSAILVDQACALAKNAGLRIVHADLTVVCQKPHLSQWKSQIRQNIARLLNLPENRINIKATTEEGMGFTGALEGIKAFAIVSGIQA